MFLKIKFNLTLLELFSKSTSSRADSSEREVAGCCLQPNTLIVMGNNYMERKTLNQGCVLGGNMVVILM